MLGRHRPLGLPTLPGSCRRAIGAVRGLTSCAILAITHAHYLGHEARVLPTQYSHAHYPGALPGRRDGDIAPYRHYTRGVRRHYAPAKFARALPGRITHGHGSRAPPVGVPYPPGSRPTAIAHAWCAWRNIRKKEPARSASSFCRGTARIVRRFRPFRRQPR